MFRAFSDISTLMSRIVPRVGQILPVALLAMVATSEAAIKNYTVSATAGKGTHLTIQAAVNDCQTEDVCTINLVDATYTIYRPVWIEGKSNITIIGKTATGDRPKLVYPADFKSLVSNPLSGGVIQAKVRKVFTLPFLVGANGLPCATDDGSGCVADPKRPAGWAMWPYKAASKQAVPINDPGDKSDTSSAYSSSGFQRNGMIVVEKSVDINIKGLSLDGGQAMYFFNKTVWSQMYDVLFGTVGINSMQSLRTSVQDCEVKNFFSGFYINGRNPGGTYGQANPDDLDLANIVPLSRFGKSGDHLFEKNFVHDNWWFLYDEIEWDLGSTIRYNVAWNNINKAFQYGDSLKDADATGDEMNNQTGGFIYMKDVTLVTHKIYNNTLYKHGIVLGFGGWRAGTQHLFYNNVLAGPVDSVKSIKYGTDWHQMLQYAGTTVYNNTFELEGGVKMSTELKKQAQIYSDTLPDPNSAGKFCTMGCWIPIDSVRVVTQVQPEFLWNNWGIAQGGYYEAFYTDKAGKRWGPFLIRETNMRDSTGLIVKMQGMDSTKQNWKPHLNMYAFKIPFQSRDPKAATFMMPEWGTNVVNKTIRHQGWAAAHRNFDGSLVDRGAYCYDSLAGKTILGVCGSQASLDIVDQQIVKINDATKAVQIPVRIREFGADFTDLKIDSIYYYSELKWADSATSKEVDQSQVAMPVPVKISAADITYRNDSVFFKVDTLPKAAVNFARFDIFASGALAGATERVPSTPGIFIWRRNPVELALKVCEDQACAVPLAKIGVGDTVFLDIQGQTSAGVKITTDVTKLYLNPPAGVRILDVATNKVIDTAMFRAVMAGGHGVFKVVFESRFDDILTAAGIAQDPTSKNYYGAVGQIALHVTSGKPWRAEWETPRSLESTLHACKDASDTANAMCDEIAPILPFNGKLRVYDRFGNSVDGYAGTINITAVDLRGVTVTFAATAAGAFAALTPVTSTDSTAAVFIVGTPAGGSWPATTAILTAQVDAPGTPIDSARVRIGKPADRLGWYAPVAIDTFINVPMKITLMVTKDGVNPTTAGNYSNAKASIAPMVTNRLKFFADAAGALPLTDTVQLVNGVAEIWVMAETPFHPLWDTVIARMPGLADPAKSASIRFRMPPKPEAPEPQAGTFLDQNCDGYADSLFVKWQPLSASVKIDKLDTTKVKITEAVVFNGTDSLVLGPSAVRILPDAAGGVGFALPAGANVFGQYNPKATIRITAALIRKPAADTIVQLGANAVVNDGIGPRPIGAVIIENPTPATVADTLRVAFSENVKYTGSTFPFRVFQAGMVEVPTTGITVVPPFDNGPSNTIRFVLTGNTNGQIVSKSILALVPGAGLTDIAGNEPRFATCQLDTALVTVKPVVVGVVRAAILDQNGDGQADVAHMVFRRDFLKDSEKPDSVKVLEWDGANIKTNPFSQATLIGPATYEVKLEPAFPLGVTTGSLKGTNGSGQLKVYLGEISALNPEQSIEMMDSVPPIAVKTARIQYNAGYDILTVYYSENMGLEAALDGKFGMVKKTPAGDQTLVLTGATPVGGDLSVWQFTVPSGALQVGDEIRLPTSSSYMKAANGVLPSATGNAPYVPVVGGDRAPKTAWILDLNGDGAADAVRLIYEVAPRGNPTFKIRWLGDTYLSFDSLRYGAGVAGKTDVIIPVSGFGTGTTGIGAGKSISYVEGLAMNELDFEVKDGIAPIITKAYVTYGANEDLPDTLSLNLSEPVAALGLDNNNLVLAWHNGVVDPVKTDASGVMQVMFAPNSSEFKMICLSKSCELPGYGDYVRLAKDAAADLGGILVGDSSHYEPVYTGLKPVRYIVNYYPGSVMEFAKDEVRPLKDVGPISVWVRAEGKTAWAPEGETKSKWLNGRVELAGELTPPLPGQPKIVGLKIDLSTDFDAQFFVYDNMGTFVGQTSAKFKVRDLALAENASTSGKYSVLVGLNGLDLAGKEMASGVYMIRVISYTERPQNGGTVRQMAQNKVFPVGVFIKQK